MDSTQITLPAQCLRQITETAAEYVLFTSYCALGRGRSLSALSKQIDYTPRRLQQLSSKHNWQSRVQAYDEMIAETVLKSHAESEIESMRNRHAQQAKNWLTILSTVERRFIEQTEDKSFIQSLNAWQLLEYITRMGSQLPKLQEAEALARGVSYKDTKSKENNNKQQTVRMLAPVVVTNKSSKKKGND